MPELPEVETVRKVLVGWTVGKTIKKITSSYPRILSNVTIDELNERLDNKQITDVKRYGKFLMICFDDDILLSHLRMEGKYYLAHYPDGANQEVGVVYDTTLGDKDKIVKHTHLVFEFTDGSLLLYHDVRKFGRFYLTDCTNCYQQGPLASLGHEPFSMPDGSELLAKTKNSRKSLKEVLLDQSLIVGLGNIYCDEVCFLSNLSPDKIASTLTKQQWDKIVENSVKVLNRAIELGGSTVRSYHFAGDADGKFQNELYVYGRAGEECKVCHSPISKTRIGGRGTHFCPNCQQELPNHKIRVVGITGLIGSGKSTVSKEFIDDGYQLLDADYLARHALDKDSPGYYEAIKTFGKQIVGTDGNINRQVLREMVAGDRQKLTMLENIIHPEVIRKSAEAINKEPNGKFLLDVPLLFESGMDKLCDLTVFVNTLEKIRIQRLKIRDTMPIKDANQLNEQVWDAVKKISLSDVVIDNSATMASTKWQVEQLIKRIDKQNSIL